MIKQRDVFALNKCKKAHWSFILEMARSKIFQARTAHSPQHPAH